MRSTNQSARSLSLQHDLRYLCGPSLHGFSASPSITQIPTAIASQIATAAGAPAREQSDARLHRPLVAEPIPEPRIRPTRSLHVPSRSFSWELATAWISWDTAVSAPEAPFATHSAVCARNETASALVMSQLLQSAQPVPLSQYLGSSHSARARRVSAGQVQAYAQSEDDCVPCHCSETKSHCLTGCTFRVATHRRRRGTDTSCLSHARPARSTHTSAPAGGLISPCRTPVLLPLCEPQPRARGQLVASALMRHDRVYNLCTCNLHRHVAYFTLRIRRTTRCATRGPPE
eukprot:SAG22_NODE_32_length_27675_cov_12.130119_9_plen_289_part_00